ncbi:secreted protein [Limosilactobacillus mucosae]|uniref:YSIRK-type signal peptide-containing protein n=1 Tax=Limosilactobacillus mucosae TaxID=97478 RepID=UPI00053C659B|nr:YSIRK-type signal peptide-containing protein [Limosilactobacillus mucosae]PWJ43481.1 secreted protein [Limosilactobacillus mucosae]RXA58409.1 YSIRK-type signal peptide-containing protein [Limosilactobacillus mucosae]SUQ20610.1 signal peptide-containing protein, YSIRK family [Limosilactobacillus mucosae]
MGRNNQNDRQRQLMSILPRYALRKTKLGCVSMLIAVGFFLGGANELNVKADALPAQNGKTATVQSKAPSADYGILGSCC